MKDPVAMAPLENGRDDTVGKTKEAAAICTNGGTSRRTSVITNGHAEKERAMKEEQESIDALENSLLQSSDHSDSENLNLELELSDEEGDVSGTESTASTIILSSKPKQEAKPEVTSTPEKDDKSEATSKCVKVEDGAAETLKEESKVADTFNIVEDSIDLGDEDTGSSQDCVVVDESEPIVDSKSSAKEPSDAANSVSKQEDISSNAKEAQIVEEGGDTNVVQTGDSDDVNDIEVIELVPKDPLDDGNESQHSQSEVVDTQESEVTVEDVVVSKEAESAEITDKESTKPEVQVIVIDDSSSESSKEAIEPCTDVAEPDQVPLTEDVTSGADLDGEASRLVLSPVEVEEEEVKEKTTDEALKETVDDSTENSNGAVAIKDGLPEKDETNENAAVEIADAREETLQLENTASVAVKLESEENDTLASEKDSSDTDNLSSELVEPEVNLDAVKSECSVNTLLSEDAENSVYKKTTEIADESSLEIALETPAASTSSSAVSDNNEVDSDEQKVEPIVTAAEIVALTLDTLLTDVVNISEGIGKSTDELENSESDVRDLIPNEIFEIGDDSDESNSLSNKTKSEEVVNKKLSDDSSQTDATIDSCDVKTDAKPDLKPLVAIETDDSSKLDAATPKPKAENITTSEESPKRPKRSTVQKAEEALVKKMKLSNGGETLPNSSRSISKENQNPAQKRGSTSAANEDAKKARIESLRQRKPKVEMSNLDKSIARVASGGKASIREQEIIRLVDELSSRTLKNITVKQLEDLVHYKIARYILDNSDCSVYRRELSQMRQDVEKWRNMAKGMAKQVRDLENVMKKMLNDMKTMNKDALPIPAKVNRSVGLQVGDGRITNEQKKLAIPRPAPPQPPPQPPQGIARRGGILTNRPGPGPTSIHLESTDTAGTTTNYKVTGVASAEVLGSHLVSSMSPLGTISSGVSTKRIMPARPPMVIPAVPTVPTLVQRLSSNLSQSTTPPKHATTSSPAQTVVTAGLTRRSMTTVSPRTQGPLIDLTDGDEMPAPRPTITTVPLKQMVPSKVRVINPANTVPPITVTKQQGTIRLVAQNTLTGPPSARMAYMVPASTAGGEPRMYFATSAPKQMNGGSVITRPAGAQPGKVVFSTNVSQMSPALRGLQPGGRQTTTYITTSRPAPNSVVRARAVHTDRRVLHHPAPLPQSPPWPNPLPGWKKPPPIPELKISKCDKRSRSGGDSGIILSWKMDALCADNDEIKSYQLYAYQETSGEPSTTMWKKVGEVTAMALPMACTLTQFTEGNKYHFAVRAVDIRGRTGPFSRPGNILLSPSFDN